MSEGPPADGSATVPFGDAATGERGARVPADVGSTPPAASGERAVRSLVDQPEEYLCEGEIARGGMGRVVAARGARLGRPVAIKEILLDRDDLRARFEREARVTARLQHPGIVPVYGIGRTPEGKPFYAMKLVSGQPLDELAAQATTLEARLALLPNVIAVVDALAYAHDQKLVHRDLKPANVLVGAFGETVVVDWGLVKVLGEEPDSTTEPAGGDDAATTAHGRVMGTPAYMPPEQARGAAVDARADVYALGAILYHVLAGAPPYRRSGEGSARWEEVRARVLLGPPVPLASAQSGLPADLVTIVDRAMARDPAARYPSAAELATDLRRFQTGQLVGAHSYSTWQLLRRWVRRHRAAVTFAVALTGVLVAGLALYLRSIRTEQRRTARERDRAVQAQLVAEAAPLIETDPMEAARRLRRALALGYDERAIRGARQWVARRLERTLDGHTLPMAGVAWSRDGRWVVSADGGNVRIWSAAEWRPIRDFALGAAGNVRGIALSPDGELIAVGQGDGSVSMWRRATGEQLWTSRVGAGGVLRVAWHPTAATIYAGGEDGTVAALGVADGAVTALATGAGVYDLVVSPAGDVAIARRDGQLTVIHTGADGRSATATVSVTSTVYAGSLLWLDHELLLGGINGRIVTVKPDDLSYQRDVVMASAGVTRLTAYQPLVAAGTADGQVIFFDPYGSLSMPRVQLGPLVVGLAFSPDGERIAAVSGHERRVRIYRAGDLPAKASPRLSGKSPFKDVVMEWDRRQDMIALGTMGGRVPARISIQRWPDGVSLADCPGPGDGSSTALAWSPDRRFLASAARDRVLRIWRWDGACTSVHVSEPLGGYVHALSWHPSLPVLAVAVADKPVALVTLEDGAWRMRPLAGEPAISVAFHPGDPTLLAVGGGSLRVYRDPVTDASPPRRFALTSGIGHGEVVWRPGAAQAAVLGLNGFVSLVDVTTGGLIWQTSLVDWANQLSALAWTPGGDELAVASNEGLVATLDARGAVTQVTRFTGSARSALWSDDGRLWVSTGPLDGYVQEVPHPAVDSLLPALDAHLAYERHAIPIKAFTQPGQAGAIGMTPAADPRGLVVREVVARGPAARAGLLPGTVITRAQGVELAGLSETVAAAYVAGPIGVPVELVVVKVGESEPRTVRVDRVDVASLAPAQAPR